MREFAEYPKSQDQYIGAQATSITIFRALLRVARSGTLLDCVARKVGAAAGVDLGESEGQQQ